MRHRLPALARAAFCSIGAACAAPAAAADLNPSITPPSNSVPPPAGRPHAFTPAPVPSVGPPTVSPSNRFGNADDAGPINSTPLSSNLSPSIGVGPNENAVRQTDPTADAVPSDGGHD